MTSGDWNAAIEADLLPCGHCGSGEVSMSYSATVQSPEPHSRFVECEACAASGPPHDISDYSSDAEAKIAAIAAWNTRQPTTPTTGEDDVERVATFTITVSEGRTSVHTHAAPSADALVVLDAAISALEHEKRALLACPHHRAALAAISPTTEDAEKRELVEALKPFAEKAGLIGKYDDGDETPDWTPFIAVKHYRRAAEILASIGERS